jgi:O-antigen ligase
MTALSVSLGCVASIPSLRLPTLGAVVAIGMVLLPLWTVFMAFVLAAVTIPRAGVHVHGIPITVSDILLVVAIARGAVSGIRLRTLYRWIWYWIFGAIAVIIGLLNTFPLADVMVDFIGAVGLSFIAPFAAAVVGRENKDGQLIHWLTIAAFVACVIGLLGWLYGPNSLIVPRIFYSREKIASAAIANVIWFHGRVIRRAFGAFTNPNAFGAVLDILLPFALVKSMDNSQGRWLGALTSVMCIVTVIVTFSRGAWLATLVEVCGMLIILPNRSSRSKAVPWLLVGSGVVALVAGSVHVLGARLSNALTSVGTTSRLAIYIAAAKIIVLNPIGIGFGAGTTYSHGQVHLLRLPLGLFLSAPVSNVFLQVGSRMGIMGLAIFVAIVIVPLTRQNLASTSRLQFAAIFAVIGFLVHSLVDYFLIFQEISMLFWLCTGLAVDLRWFRRSE